MVSRGCGKAYFARARGGFKSLDFDVVDFDHLAFETHDGHQGLDVNGVLLLEFEAVGESHRIRFYIINPILRNLLDGDRWGKRGHGEWVERYAVQFEAVALGGKFHLEIARDIFCPNSAFWAFAGSIWTAGAIKVDGLRLLSEGGRIERRGLVFVDFEWHEEGVGGQHQRRS